MIEGSHELMNIHRLIGWHICIRWGTKHYVPPYGDIGTDLKMIYMIDRHWIEILTEWQADWNIDSAIILDTDLVRRGENERKEKAVWLDTGKSIT